MMGLPYYISSMRVFHILKKCRYVSVLIIPDRNDQTFEYRLDTKLFKIMLVVGLLFVGGAIIGIVQYWKVIRVAHQAERLQRENDFLWRENAKVFQLQQTLYEMQEIDQRLKQMAGDQVVLTDQPLAEGSVDTGNEVATENGWMDSTPRVEMKDDRASVGATPVAPDGRELTLRRRPTLWPVQGWVTAEFSMGFGPFGKKHTGIDIAAPTDSPVKAAADGVVTFAGWMQDLGNLVIIEHDDSFSSRYGHNSRILVNQGEQVRRGQTVAFVGSSGRSTAPHLHFEIWRDGRPVDPRDYLVR